MENRKRLIFKPNFFLFVEINNKILILKSRKNEITKRLILDLKKIFFYPGENFDLRM